MSGTIEIGVVLLAMRMKFVNWCEFDDWMKVRFRRLWKDFSNSPHRTVVICRWILSRKYFLNGRLWLQHLQPHKSRLNLGNCGQFTDFEIAKNQRKTYVTRSTGRIHVRIPIEQRFCHENRFDGLTGRTVFHGLLFNVEEQLMQRPDAKAIRIIAAISAKFVYKRLYHRDLFFCRKQWRQRLGVTHKANHFVQKYPIVFLALGVRRWR